MVFNADKRKKLLDAHNRAIAAQDFDKGLAAAQAGDFATPENSSNSN